MSSFLPLAALDLVLGGLVFLLGLVILRENPRQKLNRVVAFMLFFGGLGAVLGALGFLAARPEVAGKPPLPQSFLGHFSYLWEFFFPTLLWFTSIFPVERPFVRRIRGFEVLIYLPHAVHFVLLMGITIFAGRIDVPSLDLPSVVRPFLSLLGLVFQLFLAVHRALFSLVNLGYGVAGAVLLVSSYRRARVPRLREQLRVIGIGLILCLALYSLASSLPTLLNLDFSEWVRSVLTITALTVGSGGIAYSMVRYKFLDTKLLARRGILYAVASAVLVGIYLAVVFRVKDLFSEVTGLDPRVFEPMFLIIALILFQPAMSRLEERLDRFFLRDPTDYRNVLRNLGRELLTEIDLDRMLDRSIRTIAEALMLRDGYVVALAREGPLVYHGAGREVAEADLAPLPGILVHLNPEVESFRVDGSLGELDEADRVLLADRFGAALVIPLRSKGETVGALILGEKLTGTAYTSEDVNLLSALAGQMSISVQNGLLLRERVAVVRIEEELNLARRIQSSFLPSTFPRMERLDIHAINTPSRQVGGDYYDLVSPAGGGRLVAIADVSGKGVPAALLTSMLQASLRTQAENTTSVSEILSGINALVYRSTSSEQFATFFLARIDEGTLRMSYSNAGHNYPVLLRRNGRHEYLERGGMMVGMFEGATFEEATVQLEPGDRVVLFTDGVSEAVNAAGQEFGEDRIRDLVRELPGDLSAREVTSRILEALHRFLDGVEPQDDVTVMVLRVLEPAPAPTADDETAVAAARG